jgi:AcrR family transcriptional regulator
MARIHARLSATTLPPRQLDPVIRLLLECLNHTLDVAGILRTGAPDAYPADRVETSFTDVLHRTLFGLRPEVNVHATDGPAPPALRFDEDMLETFRRGAAVEAEAPGSRALQAVLASARDVFVRCGYHNTRVDDLVEAAGVSHGAFYRYFRNKEELARLLTARGAQTVGATVLEIPPLAVLEERGGAPQLRRWLRRYHDAHAHEAAMLQVWVDAAVQDPAARAESAPLLDWGRRRLARYLEPRGFGDVDVDAVVMVALLGVFGARARSSAETEAAARIIERGLLGR